MKLTLRKLVRPLRLADYAPEYGDDFLSVWVNPPRAKLDEYREIRERNDALIKRMGELARAKADGALSDMDEAEAKRLGQELADCTNAVYAWYAEIWSQGPDAAKHSSPQDVRELAIQCEREDSAFWVFLCTRTWELINSHRALAKKGQGTS